MSHATDTPQTWTDERKERCFKLWSDGYSASQIAAQLGGITRNAVIGMIHRAGLKRGKQPTRPTCNRPWTPERDARLKQLWALGLSDIDTAKTLGQTTPSAVQSRRQRLGLKRVFMAVPKLPREPKAATPKLIVAGNGAVVEKPDGQPSPLPKITGSAWEPLPGVIPMLREHAKASHCKWPITVGDDELSHCCAAVATEGPYCKAHKRRSLSVNQPNEVRKARKKAREFGSAQMIFGRAA